MNEDGCYSREVWIKRIAGLHLCQALSDKNKILLLFTPVSVAKPVQTAETEPAVHTIPSYASSSEEELFTTFHRDKLLSVRIH